MESADCLIYGQRLCLYYLIIRYEETIMSVNKLNVPAINTEDSDVIEKSKLIEPNAKTKALNPDSSRTKKAPFQGPDTVSKEFDDKSSANAESNRFHNNANDPTDRDPTRVTNKPISGKIQK